MIQTVSSLYSFIAKKFQITFKKRTNFTLKKLILLFLISVKFSLASKPFNYEADAASRNFFYNKFISFNGRQSTLRGIILSNGIFC